MKNINKNMKVSKIFLIIYIEQLPTMCHNYEKRVKDFILDMNNPTTKISIKDVTERVENPRVDLLETKKIQKPFIFKGYTCELDRIKDTVKNNQYLYNLPDYDKIIKKKNVNSYSNSKINRSVTKLKIENYPKINDNTSFNEDEITKKTRGMSVARDKQYKYIIKNDLIMQPQMRFKPRTDLERVYDSLNGYHYAENEKQVIERQLRSIHLYDYKTPLDLYKNTENHKINLNTKNYDLLSKTTGNPLDFSEKKDKKNYNNKKSSYQKLYFTPMKTSENVKPWERRIDLNNEAQELLKPYHYKMHFKAAKEIASNTRRNNNHQALHKKIIGTHTSCFLLPNITPGNYFNKEIREKNISEFKEMENYFNDENETENCENFYKSGRNPLNIKENVKPTKETMNLLKNMAFEEKNKKNNEQKKDTDYIKVSVDLKNEEDDVVVGNQVINKKEHFDLLTNKVLENCNVWNKKGMFNHTILKKRTGKTMITQGMTVNEFEKKYGLK